MGRRGRQSGLGVMGRRGRQSGLGVTIRIGARGIISPRVSCGFRIQVGVRLWVMIHPVFQRESSDRTRYTNSPHTSNTDRYLDKTPLADSNPSRDWTGLCPPALTLIGTGQSTPDRTGAVARAGKGCGHDRAELEVAQATSKTARCTLTNPRQAQTMLLPCCSTHHVASRF